MPEVIYGRAKTQIINELIGAVGKGQRFSASVGFMQELEAMGLVDLDEPSDTSETVKKKPVNLTNSQPLSALPLVPPYETKTLKKRKNSKKKIKRKSS